MIHTATLAYVRDRRLLQARSAHKDVFYMAGGKIDPGETPVEALYREVREELGVEVAAHHEFGVFQCQAFGEAPGVQLHMTCFTADLTGDPRPTSEVAELRYFTGGEYETMPHVAPGSMLVFRRLRELDLIDW
ncbi:NUDIX hydrolase [Nocardia pseudobrasiliensis]|uniref:ADP-ribose pyrophosphatase YjhB (NUDIX family) n=1 Tax=Nocardia pseudobrasiliensis TaxID=45979 RepID=A0A370I7A7_9NOCA|nr:NUDIX domain-containing protein [Nocardia pseudobrasiliensis]RDI66613.1 ADP-ribose pyrophosphatase YjhB (NUDIX family) [Nocardia pseudobrasiliensis]